MLLYKSKFLEVNYLEVQYLIHLKFKEAAKEFSSEQMKQELLKFLQERVKRRGRHFFIDLTNVETKVDKEFLIWFSSEILPQIFSTRGNNLVFFTKKQIDFPKFIMVRNKLLEIRFMSDSKEAMSWLLEGYERRRMGLTGHRHHHHHN